MKTLYQYAIKTDGLHTVLVEKGHRLPIAGICENGESDPLISASLLRSLAEWAIEQAEIIEEMEGAELA